MSSSHEQDDDDNNKSKSIRHEEEYDFSSALSMSPPLRKKSQKEDTDDGFAASLSPPRRNNTDSDENNKLKDKASRRMAPTKEPIKGEDRRGTSDAEPQTMNQAAVASGESRSYSMEQEALDAKTKTRRRRRQDKSKNKPAIYDDTVAGLEDTGEDEDDSFQKDFEPQDELRPGAVRIPGVDGTDAPDETLLDEEQGMSIPEEQNDEIDKQEEEDDKDKVDTRDFHLVNAELVEPAPPQDVPLATATPFDEQASSWRRNKKLIYMLVLVAVLIVVAVVVIVVVLTTGGGSSSDSGSNPAEDLTVVIMLDDNPQDTGWSLECEGTAVVGIPPTTYSGLDNRLIVVNTKVGLNEDCRFTITDSAENGITDGFFEVYYGLDITNDAALLVDGSGNFRDVRVVPFEVVAPPATNAPTASPQQTPAPTGSQGTLDLVVEIQLDAFPAETGWSLSCAGVELISVPPRTYTIPSLLVSETFTVDIGASCEFKITDDFGDGICCDAGQGFYRIILGATEATLLAEGGEFGVEDIVAFVATPATDPTPVTSAPIGPATAPPTLTPPPSFPLGAPCDTNADCNGGVCVNDNCVPTLVPDLGLCDSDSDCQGSDCALSPFEEDAVMRCCPSGSRTVFSSDIPWSPLSLVYCQFQQPADGFCVHNALCQSGHCVNDACTATIVQDLGFCDDDSDCESNICASGNFSEAAELVCCPNGETFVSPTQIPWSTVSMSYCRGLQPAGRPCPNNVICQSGQCVNGACVASSVQDLNPCDDDSDCDSNVCAAGNFSEIAEKVCCPDGETFVSSTQIPWSTSSISFCRSQQPAGQPCPNNLICQSGQCVNGACVASAVPNLGLCDDDSDCQSNVCAAGNFSEAAQLVCCPRGETFISSTQIPWSTTSMNFCRSQQPAGQPCPTNLICQSGACVNGVCSNSTATALERCDDDSDCQSNICAFGSFREDAVLVCCPEAEEFVSATDIPWSTSSLSYCESVIPAGEPCARNVLCQSGNCINGICASSVAQNLEPCDDDSDCQNNVCALGSFSQTAELVCCPGMDEFVSSADIPWSSVSLSYCESVVPAGEPCAENSLCVSGSCVGGICANATASALGRCDDDNDCQNRQCSFGNFSEAAELVCCPSGERFVSATNIPWSTTSLSFCSLQQPAGEPCPENVICQSGHCVDGVCTADTVANFGRCDDRSDCLSNECALEAFTADAELICCPNGDRFVSSSNIPFSTTSLSFCQFVIPAGQPCGDNALCQSGHCVNGICTASAVPDLGACDDRTDCASSDCALGNFSEAAELVCCPNDDVFISSTNIPWSPVSLNYCRFQQPTGELCIQNNLCQSGICVNDACVASPVADLGACDESSDCLSANCAFETFSEEAERVCCPNDDVFVSASVIPWSPQSLSFCRFQQPNGEPCTTNTLCQSGTCTDGVCV